MPTILNILGPLWRLCTSFASYKSPPGGTAGLQIRRAGFDSPAACHTAGWLERLGAGLQIRITRVRLPLRPQRLVVIPT